METLSEKCRVLARELLAAVGSQPSEKDAHHVNDRISAFYVEENDLLLTKAAQANEQYLGLIDAQVSATMVLSTFRHGEDFRNPQALAAQEWEDTISALRAVVG